MGANNPRASDGYRTTYKDVSASGSIAAATAGAAGIVAPDNVNSTVFVQRITVAIHTLGAQTITFQDSAGTPVKVLSIEASVAVGVVRSVDFGARGFALTEGKNLDISGTAAPAYSYAVDAYSRQTSAVQTPATGSRIF